MAEDRPSMLDQLLAAQAELDPFSEKSAVGNVVGFPLKRRARRKTNLSGLQIFTTDEAARFVGVAKRTIERWRQAGTLVPETRTAGGHSRYSRRQLEPLRREHGRRGKWDEVRFPWNE